MKEKEIIIYAKSGEVMCLAKVKKPAIIFVSMMVVAGCGTYKTVTFKTDTFMSAGQVRKFEMKVPRGVKNVSSDTYHDLFKIFLYPDSATLYISLDISYAHSPNRDNWMKCPDVQTGTKCESGRQSDGRYWMEVLSSDKLIVGYLNVTSEKKALFDEAISSIRVSK